jgi:hypothetical protein
LPQRGVHVLQNTPVTGLIRDSEAESLVTSSCHDGNCLRKVIWNLDGTTPWVGFPPDKTSAPSSAPELGQPIPILCLDLCPILLAAARETVKKRMKSESDAAKAAEAQASPA